MATTSFPDFSNIFGHRQPSDHVQRYAETARRAQEQAAAQVFTVAGTATARTATAAATAAAGHTHAPIGGFEEQVAPDVGRTKADIAVDKIIAEMDL